MATTNQTFWPDEDYVAHDQVYGTDIDKMDLAAPGAGQRNNNTGNDYGTAGNKDITFDPNTAGRTTVGIVDTLGFSIQEADMDSNADARRKILAGDWTVQGECNAGLAALNNVTILARIYKVAASPSFARTLIGSGSDNVGLLPITLTVYSMTINIGQQILEAGETIQLTLAANATGQVGGLSVFLSVGDGDNAVSPTDTQIIVPAPGIRFDYPRTGDLVGKGAVTKAPLPIAMSRNLTGKGVITSSKATIAAKTFNLVGKGVATKVADVGLTRNLTGKGEIRKDGANSSTITVPIDEVPESGAVVIIAPIFD